MPRWPRRAGGSRHSAPPWREAGGLIRPGTDADGPDCLRLIAACWEEYEPGPADVRAEIAEIDRLATHFTEAGGALWAAEEAGRLVGMVGTYPAADGWHVARMYVAAGQRGTGLARDLLAAAEAFARAAGGTRMVLWSDVLFARAHAFYEKHGYVRRGGLRTLDNPQRSIEAGFAKPLTGRVVEELDIAAAESAERPLAAMLQACVATGASALFLPPLGRERAMGYWRGVTRAVGAGDVRLFAAWRNGVLAGTVQLGLDMPEDGRHRAEVLMLLIAPGSRCRGVARLLLAAAEAAAGEAGRTLLVLETRVDDHAEPLYRAGGWAEAGTIPGYVRDAKGREHGMRRYHKSLDCGAGGLAARS